MYALEDVMKEDRVRLARIRSPEQNQVGVLELLIGTRAAACPEYRRQTDDARSVSSPVAAVDIVAADDGTCELLRDIVHLVRRLRAAEHPERARGVTVAGIAQCGRNAVQSFLPRCASQVLTIAYERVRQPKIGFAHARLIRARVRIPHRAGMLT
jgi:hypothetical protein